jgi:hypothetical protein
VPNIEIRFTVSDLYDDAQDYTVSVDLTDDQFGALTTNEVVGQWGDDDDTAWYFDIDGRIEEFHDPFTADDVTRLADAILRLPTRHKITHTEAVDLIAYCLGAPEWSVSFLEDIRDIIDRTDRSVVKGASWAKH